MSEGKNSPRDISDVSSDTGRLSLDKLDFVLPNRLT